MNLSNIISILSIIASTTIALLMFAKNKKAVPNIAFALGMITMALTQFGDFMYSREPFMTLYKKISLIGESLQPGLWLLFSLTYMREKYISPFWRTALFISVIPALAVISLSFNYFLYSPAGETGNRMFLGIVGYYFYLFILIYSILILVNLEGILRASSGSIRWQIKHAIIGVGAIIVWMFYYCSNALLYRSIDPGTSIMRGLVVLLSFPLIMSSILKQTFQKEGIYISRNILYRSFTLLIAGIYLMGLGIIGPGMRYLGEDYKRYPIIALVFGGSIMMTALLFSKTLRSRLKVFIDKNFYKDKYDYRTHWLQFTQRISSSRSFDELLSAILEGFSSAIGSKSGSLWLRKDTSNIFYQAYPQDNPQHQMSLNGDNSLITFFRDRGHVFNIKDGDQKVIDENKDFFEKTHSSLIVPLMNNGNVNGFVILGESLINNIYNYEDYDLLKTLSRQATSAIMNMRLAEELAEAREMEAVGRISSFIIHDLKNLTSTISMAVENAKDNINDPDFQKDMIRNLSNTVSKMRDLIKRLSDIPEKMVLRLEKVDITSLIQETIMPFMNGKTKIEFEFPGEIICNIDREEIRKVVENLVLNAFEATNEGTVRVKLNIEDNMVCIKVSDNGCGMSKDYIEKYLFKPFYTTKKKGLGIGLYQSKSIIEAHGGNIKVKSREGEGTEFYVYLPLD